jgi:hypothetical protein
MSKTGVTGDSASASRRNNTPKDNDEQSELELEFGESGRHDAFPREGLAGAHTERRAPPAGEAWPDELRAEESEEGEAPTGPASDVAPTERATARERERHRIERQMGHTPAGEEGRIHGRNAPGVTREGLDDAARQADRVTTHERSSRAG